MRHSPCIIVHAGAGYHAKRNEKLYNVLCAEACNIAASILSEDGRNAVDAVAAAVAHLEDSQLTNAGLGSNLTFMGAVECDAGIMEGKSLHFAGVGAVPGVKNPVFVVKSMLEEQSASTRTTHGRVRPSLISGLGARQWALSRGLTCVADRQLVSEKSYADWKKYRSWLDTSDSPTIEPGVPASPDFCASAPKCLKYSALDTVGAVCIDRHGAVASAASSGGIALKQEGRIGQACVYGCGCWAEETASDGTVGVVTSGTGEQLIRTQLAQRSAERMLSSGARTTPELLELTLTEDFINSRFLRSDEHRFAGLAGAYLHPREEQMIEVFFGHTTQSMSVAYYVPDVMPYPSGCVSRRTPEKPLRFSVIACRI